MNTDMRPKCDWEPASYFTEYKGCKILVEYKVGKGWCASVEGTAVTETNFGFGSSESSVLWALVQADEMAADNRP